MKIITKEMCLAFVKDYYKSKIVLQSIISVFVVVGFCFFVKNLFVVLIVALLLVMLCIYRGVKIKNKVVNIYTEDFCLEEDVVIDFKKRFVLRKNQADKKYIYTFKKYGKHTISISVYPTIEIPLHKDKNISALAVDRLSIQSCNVGDVFYLLILLDGKKKIVQCFYKQYFNVQKEDFEYIDGKYYCKKH